MTEIKPCPFCGSTGTIKPRKDKICGLHVVCQNVNCQATRLPWQDTPEFAIKIWNTRIGDDTAPQECLHETLFFGSGDYYLICSDCKRYWVMIGNNGDEADASLSNIGKAAHLSGEERTKA